MIGRFEIMRRNAPHSRLRRAFTLIELLVVIAIISILVGLLFPVFATVMENSRQSSTMSNMQQIGSALALYKLDNKHYPPVLFAYAHTGDTMATVGNDTAASAGFGLYPTYIKDWHVFTCSNNVIDDPGDTVTANVNTFTTAGGGRILAPVTESFYKMDAFDVSPKVNTVNQVTDPKGSQYVVRYQTSWTDYTATPTSIPSGEVSDSRCFPSGTANASTGNCTGTLDPDYSRQLRWSNPPPDTYVTSTSDHVPNSNKILVLYLDGSVRKVNVQDGWQTDPGATSYAAAESAFIDSTADISYDSANQQSLARFWRTTVTR